MLREFRARFRALRTPAAVMAIAATLVAGCGIKGPLRLPPPATAVPAPASTPAPVPPAGTPASSPDATASPPAAEPRAPGTSAPPKP
jgi:predicted small lipoprotein YifL